MQAFRNSNSNVRYVRSSITRINACKNRINYQQIRTGVMSDFITNKLSFGYKTRGIKSRENFKPKGILVYKSKYIPYFRYGTIGAVSFATAFTAITAYDFIYPVEYLAMNGVVMTCAVITVWLLPGFVLPSFGRRYITRMWLENNWWIHIESHSRTGNLRHLRIPIGFARIPEKQFGTLTGMRRYILGLKMYNEWGFYYLRRTNGRFLDTKSVEMMFGANVLEMLEDQNLVQPIELPSPIMDDQLFPPTDYQPLFELEKQQHYSNKHRMELEESVFETLKFWKSVPKWWRYRGYVPKILRYQGYRGSLHQKRTYKQQLLGEGKSHQEIFDFLTEHDLQDVYDPKEQSVEELMDFKKTPVLAKLPMFATQLSAAKQQRKQLQTQAQQKKKKSGGQTAATVVDIGEKFPDLYVFNAREVRMMKEYKQIGFFEVTKSSKGKGGVANEDGSPQGNRRAYEKRAVEEKRRLEMNSILDFAYGRMRQIEFRMTDAQNKAKYMRFIEAHTIYKDERGNQVMIDTDAQKKKKMKKNTSKDAEENDELMHSNNANLTAIIDRKGIENTLAQMEDESEREILMRFLEKDKKTGYVTSSYVIDERDLREGLNPDRVYINPTKKKRGKKYWRRHIGDTWRPRRFGVKRWTTQWNKKVVFDKVKRSRKEVGKRGYR